MNGRVGNGLERNRAHLALRGVHGRACLCVHAGCVVSGWLGLVDLCVCLTPFSDSSQTLTSENTNSFEPRFTTV